MHEKFDKSLKGNIQPAVEWRGRQENPRWGNSDNQKLLYRFINKTFILKIMYLCTSIWSQKVYNADDKGKVICFLYKFFFLAAACLLAACSQNPCKNTTRASQCLKIFFALLVVFICSIHDASRLPSPSSSSSSSSLLMCTVDNNNKQITRRRKRINFRKAHVERDKEGKTAGKTSLLTKISLKLQTLFYVCVCVCVGEEKVYFMK